jgi:flagellar biosynthetic protein FliR
MFDVVTWFLIFARLGAILAFFPLFSGGNVPVVIRIALSALVAFLVLPSVPTVVLDNHSVGLVIRSMVIEVTIGVLLGFICRLVFLAIELAAGILASEMGLSMSTMFNPLNSQSMPTPGILLYWLAIMLMFTMDMHHWLLAGFQKSFTAVPIGAAGMSQALYTDIMARGGKVFFVAIQMTAPVLACSFLVTMIFSVLGRAVPQMNVFAESFPVKSLAGMFVFGTTTTLMATHIMNYLKRLPADFLKVAQLLGGGGA